MNIREDGNVDPRRSPYYRQDLALVHHLGFGFHADMVAPGILKLLEPVRSGNGMVVELGCGGGLLTRHLVEAGHRVIATDASPAMLALAQETAPGVEQFARLVLPDEPRPSQLASEPSSAAGVPPESFLSQNVGRPPPAEGRAIAGSRDRL